MPSAVAAPRVHSRGGNIDDVGPQALAAAGSSPTLANPSIIRGSVITTDNGDLAREDAAGRVLTELNGRVSS